MVDRLNDFDKRYIYKFISTVQLPGLNIFDSQIQIHTGTQTNGVSLAKESQEHMTKITANMVSLIKEHTKDNLWGVNGQTDSIKFKIIMTLNTKM